LETMYVRRVPRHSLDVNVEVTNLDSGVRINQRTKDISLYGCGVDTAMPFPAGASVMLKIAYKAENITLFGRVVYGRPDIGMGIAFTTSEHEDLTLLAEWIAGLATPEFKS